MSRRNEARTTHRSAPLASEFGLSYATRLFGEETIASLPVLTRGPNKGKPRGYVLWLRTVSAGYHPNVGGGVGEGVTVRAWLGEGAFTPERDAIRATWLGRVQNVCGSMCVLGPANREKILAEHAAEAADRARVIEELRRESAS